MKQNDLLSQRASRKKSSLPMQIQITPTKLKRKKNDCSCVHELEQMNTQTHKNIKSLFQSMLLQLFQSHYLQSLLMSAFQNDWWSDSFFHCLLPSCHTKAPLIACFQTWEVEFRKRCYQIIATACAEIHKLIRHQRTNDMDASVLKIGITIAIAKPTRAWLHAAGLEFLS